MWIDSSNALKIALTLLLVHTAAAESFQFDQLNGLAGAFEGIDTVGHAFLVEKLGDVGAIPLYAYWSSDDSVQSPLLGAGWRIPLLESQMAPKDENTYEFRQPDGKIRYISVSRSNAENLVASRVWSGRVKGDEISLVGDPGDGSEHVELAFRQGRLARMKTEEGSFDFGYAKRVPEKVSSKGQNLLTITRDARDPSKCDFLFADKSRVSIVRRDDSLEMSWSDGRKKTFTRGMQGERASLQAGEHSYTWDRYSKKIVTFDGWSYTFGEAKPEWNNPPVTRYHADGSHEFYWFNLANGKGEYKAADGSKYQWARFPSGDLYGLMRWSEKTLRGKLQHRSEFTYDSMRRLVYERLSRGEAEREDGARPALEERWYAQNGQVRRMRFDGKDVKP